MGLLIACECGSEEDTANRFDTETLNRLEEVSWGEFDQAKPEIPFLFNAVNLKRLRWFLLKR